MTAEISLRKGKLSTVLLNCLQDYYKTININPDYILVKWQQWQNDPEITISLVKKSSEVIGWVIYNSKRSTIEEILLKKEWRDRDIEPGVVDALIKRESLLAAEIVDGDEAKYQWMVDYGFRPTRSFNIGEITGVKLDLSTAVLIKKSNYFKTTRTYSKKELVAIERIPETQTEMEIKIGLDNLLDNLGGLNRFVKPGQTVVIKPNVVSDHGLKDGFYKGGIVTDIRLIKALVKMLLPVAGKVIIAEGSSINRSKTSKMFNHYGYDSVVAIDPAKISLVDLNEDVQIEKTVPGGKRMSARKVPLTIEKADVLISIPVMKIHFAAVVSLSIKNLQGAVPPLEKYMSHFFGLWQNLVNISHLVKPHLIIIDGLTGQEGFGPLSGTPKQMDVLIGGTNPVAVDSVTMRIMGIDPVASPPVYLAYLQGLGPIEPAKIKIIGSSIDEVRSEFEQPKFNLVSGRDIRIHEGSPCQGCRAYFHFTLSKLRKPDPQDRNRHLIDRPFNKKVNIYLGPSTEGEINQDETNIFMGICQQHHAQMGVHLPGCPPHTEVIIDGIYSLFPDIEKAKYADKSEEARLGEMLQEIIEMNR